MLAILTLGRLSGTWFAITLVLTFFTWGEIFSLFPATSGDYFGTRHANSNYAFLYSAKGVASIIAGGMAALLFERFGNWTAAFYGSAALALISAVMALILKSMALPKKVECRRGANPLYPRPSRDPSAAKQIPPGHEDAKKHQESLQGREGDRLGKQNPTKRCHYPRKSKPPASSRPRSWHSLKGLQSMPQGMSISPTSSTIAS